MPSIEISKATYKMLLKDLASGKARPKGSLLKFSGRWSNVPNARLEEVKELLRVLREESRESVL